MDPRWSYPTGWWNPQVVKISAALPAQGAWDTPLELRSDYAQHLTLFFTYTRGAAGGAFDWQLEATPLSIDALAPTGAAIWHTEAIFAAGAVALGADTQDNVQRDYQTYGSQGAAAEDFSFDIALDGNVERYRVLARESADGVVGTPGTLQITGELRIR